jgi:acid phosphatase (class B)
MIRVRQLFLLGLTLSACQPPAPSSPTRALTTSPAPATVAAPSTRASTPACATTAANIPLAPAKVDEIAVDQLAMMLPRRPIVVGFDVDDTLVFSAPAFNALQPKYEPDIIRPKSYDALTLEQRAKYHEFWNALNVEYDERSLPKAIGKHLLDLHIARGDDIWIISKRQSIVPAPQEDVVTRRYERMFGVKLQHPVVQTQLKDKTPFICERHIEYYYGDSDGDVTSSVAAGATPIRVKRAEESYAKDAVHNGQLGEVVLRASER